MTEKAPWDNLASTGGTNNGNQSAFDTSNSDRVKESVYSPDVRYGTGKPRRIVIKGDLKNDSGSQST